MEFLRIEPGEKVTLKSEGQLPEQVHLFDQSSIEAINSALAARRPLLVRGEPGVGKSQLARAAAVVLKRAFVPFVVDAHCKSHDLMWHFDAVQRLADAQIGHTREELAIRNYIHPGPLWWAFEWNSAMELANAQNLETPPVQAGCDAVNGCVVLIDEIDKAEMDVPNGLLEALGEGSFTPMGGRTPIRAGGEFPLVIITTNEERALPAAFLRRCLVLHINPFANDADAKTLLFERAMAHFPGLVGKESVVESAVEQLLKDRASEKAKGQLLLPGQAELLDLLRAVMNLWKDGLGEPEALMKSVAKYVMEKQSGARL